MDNSNVIILEGVLILIFLVGTLVTLSSIRDNTGEVAKILKEILAHLKKVK